MELLPQTRQRIDFLAPPFAGHLHPVLCMGRMLAGHHDVRVVSTLSAMSRIRAAGLEGIALMGARETELWKIANPAHAVGSNPVRLLRQFKAAIILLGDFRRELLELYRKARQPEIMIADFTLPVAGAVAKSLNIRWWTSLPSPCVIETPDGPPAYCGGLRPALTWRDRLLHGAARRKVSYFKSSLFWFHRRPLREIGFPRLYRSDGTEATYSPDIVLALGHEEFEFKRTWPKSVRFVGPMLYTPPSDAPPPDFEHGRRHVLVTLGTHLAWHKDAVASSVEKLSKSRPEWMFHFTDGDDLAKTTLQYGNFARLPYLDYEKYVRRYDAVIHHGGAGIMYYCLRDRKPALVYPIDYDQFDHAARLEVAGQGIWLKGGPEAIERAGPILDSAIFGLKSLAG